MNKCSVCGCNLEGKNPIKKGMCNMHYHREYRAKKKAERLAERKASEPITISPSDISSKLGQMMNALVEKMMSSNLDKMISDSIDKVVSKVLTPVLEDKLKNIDKLIEKEIAKQVAEKLKGKGVKPAESATDEPKRKRGRPRKDKTKVSSKSYIPFDLGDGVEENRGQDVSLIHNKAENIAPTVKTKPVCVNKYVPVIYPMKRTIEQTFKKVDPDFGTYPPDDTAGWSAEEIAEYRELCAKN